MARQKLLKDISTEELLSLLDSSSEKKSYTTSNDVADFLNFYSITPGKNPLVRNFLYHLYKNWTKNPIDKERFSLEVNKYLYTSHSDERYYYLINQDAFSLNKKVYDLLKKNFVEKTKSPKYKKHFDSFIKFYEIKKGSYWITLDLFYYLYKLWTYKIKNKNPLGIKQFTSFCKLYFITKEVKKEIYINIDESINKYLTKERLQRYDQIKEHKEKANKKK